MPMPMPMVIESSEPAVLQLPWETLHHPELGFLGREPAFALSRRLAPPPDQIPTPEPGHLRVLLFTSLPEDLDPERARLDVEAEQDAVQEALAPWIAAGLVDLRMPNDGRFGTFTAALRSFAPQLVFLSGHGRFHQEPLTDRPGRGEFVFEGPQGESDPVPETEIAESFVGSGVQCLVLSACESGKAASDALNSGLARRLSLRGLPHVVGMRESVPDRAGIRFAHAFCDALARRERVDLALQAARRAITRPLEGDGNVWRRDAEDPKLAGLSLGQWCLPMLLSADPGRPLIDWGFEPKPPAERPVNQSLAGVTLPPRFLGRRKELRALEGELGMGKRCRLLITGPGGQGKTALAGKLAPGLQAAGWAVLAWSARPGNPFRDFRFELEFLLSADNTERYTRMEPRCQDEACRAGLLLRLLLDQYGKRVLLFLDNLESLQRPDTLALDASETGATVGAWIAAAETLCDQGLVLLMTSRWRLPDWPETDHWQLEHASYGDFLQQARSLRLPSGFYRERERLRRAHQVLHGNWRGLEFFAAAVGDLDPAAEKGFLDRLGEAEAETQTDMALETVIAHRTEDERALLARLPAYRTPVPMEGIVKLGLDLPDPERLLKKLLAVSLVEQREAPELLTREYQCSPLVAEWLQQKGTPAPEHQWLKTAAEYQIYLFRHERPTLGQAVAAHQALELAGDRAAADRWALDRIVEPLSRAGLYASLLDHWLPPICRAQAPALRTQALDQTGKQLFHTGDYQTAVDYLEQSLAIFQEIGDRAGEGTTLNNISAIYHAQGDDQTAVGYLEQSLAIQQEIGDRMGEGATLNNISTIYHAQGDDQTAVGYLRQSLAIQQEIGDVAGLCTTLFNMGALHWEKGEQAEAIRAWVRVYRQARPMGLKQVLDALEGLAGQLGLPGGLDAWEELARRMDEQAAADGPAA